MRPTHAVVDLNQLKRNFLNIRKKIGKVKIMAVVKADAYGHGVEQVVRALNTMGDKRPEYYSVALPDEGAELRKFEVSQPILILEPFDQYQVYQFVKNDLIASVFNDVHLKTLLKKTAQYRRRHPGYRIKVQVKIDTGMNRLGIRWEESFDFIKKLSANKNFRLDGIYTHFATSDEKNKSFARLQIKRFNEIIERLKKENINTGLIHAANSGAILDLPEAYYDMVRPGILMFGNYPSNETTESIPVKPIMSIISEVTSIKDLEPGESVGYSRSFTTSRKTRIASVPIGYADGFSRGLSNRIQVIIKGKFYHQIGNISMDRSIFDIGYDDIKVGDKVIILGKYKNLEISARDWAEILNTISYEITLNISGRVPRIYKD